MIGGSAGLSGAAPAEQLAAGALARAGAELARDAPRPGPPDVPPDGQGAGSLVNSSPRDPPLDGVIARLLVVMRSGRLLRAAGNALALAIFYAERGGIELALAHCQAAWRLAPDEELIGSLFARLVLNCHHHLNPPRIDDTRARWQGEPLEGTRLVVTNEEAAGLGDHLLWARFLPAVVERARAAGGAVFVAAPPELVRLWRHNFPDVEIVPVDQLPPPPHRWFFLEASVQADGLPSPCPYLRADPADVEFWHGCLRLRSDTVNVGVVWQPGSRSFARSELAPMADLAKQGHALAAFAPLAIYQDRAISLADLAPLVGIPGVRWFGLQKGPGAWAPAPPGMQLRRLGPALRDFADTAAVASALDLVITVDTSTANLVGALGLASWVLLPMVEDARWGAYGLPPWFPTVRLFRQQQPGDWSEPIARVADELARLVAARGAA
jgi:hypothetical protein